jgi:molybdopterin molybdotransferase
LRLTSLDDALQLARTLAVQRADAVALESIPPTSVAAMSGYGVVANDISGASPHGPVPLGPDACWLNSGDALPQGLDTVLEEGLVIGSLPFAEAIGAPARGEGVLRRGGDAAAGARVLAGSAHDTSVRRFVLAAARLDRTKPRALIHASPDMSAAIASMLDVFAVSEAPDIEIIADWRAPTGTQRIKGLALEPARLTGVWQNPHPVLTLPPRPEGQLAALMTVGCALCGLAPAPAVNAVLSSKVVSPVGFSSLVYVAFEKGLAHPIGSAGLSLADIARADGYILIPSGQEGYAAGQVVAVAPLNG